MTEKELFNSYFKKNFKDLHKAICCGDLVAINYKKAMWKSWQASAKRDGFKLVPKKCTNNMAHAAKSVDARLSVFKYSDVWDAMLSVVEVQE